MPLITKKKPVLKLLYTMPISHVAKKVRITIPAVSKISREYTIYRIAKWLPEFKAGKFIKLTPDEYKSVRIHYFREGFFAIQYKSDHLIKAFMTSRGKKILLPLWERELNYREQLLIDNDKSDIENAADAFEISQLKEQLKSIYYMNE